MVRAGGAPPRRGGPRRAEAGSSARGNGGRREEGEGERGVRAAGALLVAAWRSSSATRPGLVMLAISSAFMGMITLVQRERIWLWLLSALPAWYSSGMSLGPGQEGGSKRSCGRSSSTGGQAEQAPIEDPRKTGVYLGTVPRYALLATLLLGLCLSLFDAAHDPSIREWIGLPTAIARAARCGFAGAYVYVLILLGLRTYQHDVTVGVAFWSAATLALGPVMAGALSSFWEPQVKEGFTNAAVYFLAGFAPRFVAEAITDIIRRTWFSKTPAADAARSVPITQVRGIDARVGERLEEEGITSVSSLAAADPLRLLRNTSFDKRQIVGWIDNALLHTALPKHWQPLEDSGVRGAMDLAALVADDGTSTDAQKLVAQALAQAAGPTLTEILVLHTASLLRRSAQMQILEVLDDLDDGEADPVHEPK